MEENRKWSKTDMVISTIKAGVVVLGVGTLLYRAVTGQPLDGRQTNSQTQSENAE